MYESSTSVPITPMPPFSLTGTLPVYNQLIVNFCINTIDMHREHKSSFIYFQ